jgi:hypothetical protein
MRNACIAFFLAILPGCHHVGVIEVDVTTQPPRFIVDQHGWPKPFWWPRVTEFALASDEDGAVWELRSESSRGKAARQLAFIYGETPVDFVQVTPEKSARPRALVPGRTYFVAAGGPSWVYRIVFALPVNYWTPVGPPPTSAPGAAAPRTPTANLASPAATSAPAE